MIAFDEPICVGVEDKADQQRIRSADGRGVMATALVMAGGR